MIKHVHLNECDSTQDQLKEQLNNLNHGEQILVSTENQISGKGRGDNQWVSMPGTLCFSINIKPHSKLSFTALEISVIISKFFECQSHRLKLKWPNDLLDQDFKKCGGILIQSSQGTLLAGVGLNLFTTDNTYGGIFSHGFEFDKKSMSRDITEFILANRYSDTELIKRDWLDRCGHLNQMVKIIEGNTITEGIFQGLGENGQAEICTDGKIKHVYNGSLRFI